MRKLCLFPPFFLCFLITISIFAGVPGVRGDDVWVRPYSHYDPDGLWTTIERSYDANTVTYAETGMISPSTSRVGYWYVSIANSSSVRLYLDGAAGVEHFNFTVGVARDIILPMTYVTIEGGDVVAGWNYFNFTAQQVGIIMVNVHNVWSWSWYTRVFEVEAGRPFGSDEGWVVTGRSEGWNVLTPTYLSPNYDAGGDWCNMTKNIDLFEGASMNFTFLSPYDAKYDWYWAWGAAVRSMKFKYVLQNVAENFYVQVALAFTVFDDVVHFQHAKTMIFMVDVNGTDVSGSASNDPFSVAPSSVYLYWTASATELTVECINNNLDRDNVCRSGNFTTTVPEDFFVNCTMSLQAWCDGSAGWTDTLITYEFTDSYTVIPWTVDFYEWHNPFWDWVSQAFGGAFSLLPENIRTMITQITGWLGPLGGALTVVWSAFLMLLPFAPFLLLAWVLDAGLTSVNRGSIEPIGNVASTIFGLAGTLISTTVGIVETIWNFIHLW